MKKVKYHNVVMKRHVKYWYGVYRDYACNTKIAQLCLSVDDLSCDGCIILEMNFERYRELKIRP